jgi:hypothetical protein
MKTKKDKSVIELTAYEKIYALLIEDFNDTEMQERYDNFKKTREAAKERHNAMIPDINLLIQKMHSLKTTIVDLALQSLSTEESANLLRSTYSEFNDMKEKVEYQKSIMDKEDQLIKLYKEDSDRKLFWYWKVLKSLDENIEPWLEWKIQYENHII